MKIKLSHTAIRTLVTFHLKGFCVDLQLPGESHLESIRRCPKWRLFSFLSFSLFIARSLSFPEGVNSPNAFSYLRENVQVRKRKREKNGKSRKANREKNRKGMNRIERKLDRIKRPMTGANC